MEKIWTTEAADLRAWTGLLVLHVVVSAFMTGLCWFVQVVHYPGFAQVSAARFGAYHQFHTAATGSLVILPMLAELGLAALLVAWRPGAAGLLATWLPLAGTLVVWGLTMGVMIPLHGRLAQEDFSPELIRRLVAANAWRTAAWTLKTLCIAAGLLQWLMSLFPKHP